MVKNALSLVAVLTVFSVTTAQEELVDLTWKPEIGKTLSYKIVSKSSMDFGDITVSMVTSNTVKKIEEGKITVDGTMKDMTIMLGDQDVTSMAGIPSEATSTVVISEDGAILSMTGGEQSMAGGLRTQQLSAFRYPKTGVKIGGEWTADFAAKASEGLPPAKAKFTLEASEMVGGVATYRVKFAYSEMEGDQPFGSIGTYWIDQKNRDLVKMEATYENVQFGEGMPATNAQVTVTRL